MPRDVEAGYALEQQRAGYTAAAEWLASDADNETFVFRKFDKLAALNLLFLQSEILQIEEKFAKLHQDALHGTMSVKDAGRRWEALMSQAQIGGPHFQQSAVEKMALVGELRVRMREYRECEGARVGILTVSWLKLTRLMSGKTRPCSYRVK